MEIESELSQEERENIVSRVGQLDFFDKNMKHIIIQIKRILTRHQDQILLEEISNILLEKQQQKLIEQILQSKEIKDIYKKCDTFHSLLGKIYWKLENFEKGLKFCNAAILLNKNNAKAYNYKANCLSDLGKKKQAVSNYLKGKKIDPCYIDIYINLGALYNETDKQEKAEEIYQEALKLNFVELNIQDYQLKLACVYNNLANVYLELLKPEKAIEFYQKSCTINPNDSLILNNLANTYELYFQNKTESINFYKQQGNIDQKDKSNLETKQPKQKKEEKYNNKQIIKFKLQLMDNEDEESGKKVSHGEKHENSENSVKQEKLEKQENQEKLENCPKNEKEDIQKSLEFGKQLMSIKEYEIAEFYFEKVIYKEHNNLEAILQNITCLIELKMYQKALKQIDENLLIFKDNVDLLTLKGKTLFFCQKIDQSIEFCQKAIELKFRNQIAYNYWGNCLKEKKQYDLAIEKYKKSIELDPNYSFPYNNIGVCFYMQERFYEAKKYLKMAIYLQPDYEIAYNNLGNVYDLLGMKEEAIEQYKIAVKLNPIQGVIYENWIQLLRELKTDPQKLEKLRNLKKFMTELPSVKSQTMKKVRNYLYLIRNSQVSKMFRKDVVYEIVTFLYQKSNPVQQ
ncbi:hypothetical protein PPERSA_06088 [Pseudocohnilembus persalinus]|uniref:Uncharacterized protein n=1 Tax=Pseudocohnilembus persalinus TaxID=266149 RepID=A0A0V0QVG8_PSEPJ|nr:hypothetical protein PPERSA_06088 [Pseudocohnilembus persalinus]|eukprot:KRX06206.1 hypothetical protein PPERSA_06088 [Pseudocohnilembus persalinus]